MRRRLTVAVVFADAGAFEIDSVANRTLTEENLDDDGDDTLKEPEGKPD
jgi:hypothetical protein